MSQWHFRDLWTNHQTGMLRETVFWSNICKACATYAYLRYVTAQNYESMTAVLVGALIAHELYKTKQNQDQQRLDKSNGIPP
jgi:hypothetical protein